MGKISFSSSIPMTSVAWPSKLEQTLFSGLVDIGMRWKQMQGVFSQGIVFFQSRDTGFQDNSPIAAHLSWNQQESLGVELVAPQPAIDASGDFPKMLAAHLQILLEQGELSVHRRKKRIRKQNEFRVNHSIETDMKCGCYWQIDFRSTILIAKEGILSGKMGIHPHRFSYSIIRSLEKFTVLKHNIHMDGDVVVFFHFCQNCGLERISIESMRCCPLCDTKGIESIPMDLPRQLVGAFWLLYQSGKDRRWEFPIQSEPTLIWAFRGECFLSLIPLVILLNLILFEGYPFQEIVQLGPVLDERSGKKVKSDGDGSETGFLESGEAGAALRFFGAVHILPGKAIRFSSRQVNGYRRFIRKIRNAIQYIMKNLQGNEGDRFDLDDLSDVDRWILHLFNTKSQAFQVDMDNFRWHRAADSLYQLIWIEFCNWYLELAKSDLDRLGCRKTLKWALTRMMLFLYPILPTIASEIKKELSQLDGDLILDSWTGLHADLVFWQSYEEIENLKRMISELRALRKRVAGTSLANMPFLVKPSGERERILISTHFARVSPLIKPQTILIVDQFPESMKMYRGESSIGEIGIQFESEDDWHSELRRLQGELNRIETSIQTLEKQSMMPNLENAVASSPMHLIRGKLLRVIDRRVQIRKDLEHIS